MKRLIQLFLVIITILLGTFRASPLYAQDATTGIWPDQGTADSFEAAASGDVNATAHVANVNSNNYADLIRRIAGPVPGVTVTSMNSPLAKQMLAQSALFQINNYILAIFTTPPANTYAFVNDMGQTLGFMPKKANAQGVGFSGLSVLLPIWKVFRNMSYFVLAIVMVVIGFLVMFRKKIDPKTVVTVQNALPRIVIALLLITFSYAIVGIMLDLMYLSIALIGGLFKSANLLTDISAKDYLNGELYGSVFNTVKPWELMSRVLFGSTQSNVGLQIGLTIAGALASAFQLYAVGVPTLIAGAGPLLLGALFYLGMLVLVIRLFFFFISVYIKIIMSLLFSPFQLLMEAVPGSNAFSSWIKNLTANILVFPASTAMFLIASVFMNISNGDQSLWAPPYAHLFVNNATSVGTIVALGILFTIPTVGKMIQDAFKVKQAQTGAGITQSLTSPISTAMQGVSIAANVKMLGGDQLWNRFTKKPQPEK